MVTREDLVTAREDLVARREALMERAQEIREQFAEEVDMETVTMAAGLAIMSGGLAWALTMGMRGRRKVTAFLIPGALIMGGLFVAATGAARRRGAQIDEAEQRVREELAALDPLARVRVLRDMAGEQLSFVRHAAN